jgi:ERCC4-type nuclease
MIKALGSIAIPCSLFTDCVFWGDGLDGEVLTIGVERKKIGDLAQCINTGRLLNQMQIAKENNADVYCLIVETGEIRPDPDDGVLETRVWRVDPVTHKKRQYWDPVLPIITYSRLDQYLTELDYLAGVIVKRSFDVRETAAIILALYTWFQRPLDRHQSLKMIYKQPRPSVSLVRPGLLRRLASELPDIGWEKSGAAEQHFGSVIGMMLADEKDWQRIPGIGKTTAQRVVASIWNTTGGQRND